MQADKTALEKFRYRHLFPPVVVSITDDEAGKDKEKIDRQIAVIDPLVEMAGCEGFEQVETYDRKGGYSPQSVENVVMGFGICKCGR